MFFLSKNIIDIKSKKVYNMEKIKRFIMNEEMTKLSERLNRFVKESGKTMVLVSAESGVGYQTIYEMRRNRGKSNPRLNIAVKMDEYLKANGY